MVKSENFQKINNEGNLSEKCQKEKGKYEILQKQKHDKKKKKEKVTSKENCTESNLEKKYLAEGPEKRETWQVNNRSRINIRSGKEGRTLLTDNL